MQAFGKHVNMVWYRLVTSKLLMRTVLVMRMAKIGIWGRTDVNTHPSHRAGMPEDITEACEYLLGDGFVTGQNLIVDGDASKVKRQGVERCRTS